MTIEHDKQDNTMIEQRSGINRGICNFIDQSPSPFHATQSMSQLLSEAGFQLLDESECWALKAGEKYYVTRNQSSLIAWQQGVKPVAECGWRMLGAHTDSPCLKIKPQPDLHKHNAWRLGVEVYGGALLNPWFDRDLSIAGRVHYSDGSGEIQSALVDFKCPVATIPSLAIHLDREANTARTINPQLHLPVLLSANAQASDGDFQQLLLEQVKRNQAADNEVAAQKVLDHELYLYDTQSAAIIGLHGDFIAAARLDNLLSCYVDTQALIHACDESGPAADWSLLVCSDHEEVGSKTAAGAGGPFLSQVLQRIESEPNNLARALSCSMLISTDNAHALHPNYADKLDANHAPLMNGGPVIKVNANQRYASNSETQAVFRAICSARDIPVQNFVMRSDMACGSTIGPITASELGIKTLDIGLPTFAMHSIRELAGSHDALLMHEALKAFYARL